MDAEANPGHPPPSGENEQVVSSSIFEILYENIGYVAWATLIVGVTCSIIYRKYKPTLNEWMRKREEQKEAELYHKNPDLLLAKELAIENARKRLQDKYDAQAREFAEKQKLREEQKKREKIAEYDAKLRGDGGRTLKETAAASVQPKKTTFKPEYNPMTGEGGSCSFRPVRRSGRSGG